MIQRPEKPFVQKVRESDRQRAREKFVLGAMLGIVLVLLGFVMWLDGWK